MQTQSFKTARLTVLATGLILASTVASLSPSAQANSATPVSDLCKNSYSLISYELRPKSVPRFIKALEGELALSKEQKQQLKKITDYVPKNVLPMRDHIKNFEMKIVEDFVEQGQTPEQLASRLDELQTMKRHLAVEEIRVFNQLKQLLSPQQYKTAIEKASH